MSDLLANTGVGNAATNECARELGLRGSQVHHDAANLVDRFNEQNNNGITSLNQEPLFSPELAHNGMVDPDHRRDMEDIMRCGLAKHGYGDAMAREFNGMYSDAIQHEARTHRLGDERH